MANALAFDARHRYAQPRCQFSAPDPLCFFNGRIIERHGYARCPSRLQGWPAALLFLGHNSSAPSARPPAHYGEVVPAGLQACRGAIYSASALSTSAIRCAAISSQLISLLAAFRRSA